MKTELMEQVLKTVKNYDMLKARDAVLVAVSGGPDSVFLLHALSRLKSKLGLSGIFVANLDHGLRGAESEGDSLFVKKVSAKLGLECIHRRVKLEGVKSKKYSTEELAREARYEFFSETAGKTGANVLATGHTLDDQAETILMRFIKGASLKGIVGIAPVRMEGTLRIIRPLIELEKARIKNYLDLLGMSYRIDRTNSEPIYFRNIVRNDIIPYLERYNPRLKRALFNLAQHLREDFEFIEEEKSKASKYISPSGSQAIEIKLKDIVIQPSALQKEILRDALNRIGGEVKRLSFRHWKDMESLIKYKKKGDSIDLPGAIRITRTDEVLRLGKL